MRCETGTYIFPDSCAARIVSSIQSPILIFALIDLRTLVQCAGACLSHLPGCCCCRVWLLWWSLGPTIPYKSVNHQTYIHAQSSQQHMICNWISSQCKLADSSRMMLNSIQGFENLLHWDTIWWRRRMQIPQAVHCHSRGRRCLRPIWL